MVRVAIVEDDPIYTEQLRSFLKRHQQESGESYQITAFTDGEDIVEHYKPVYDIILLDIEMRFLDGMSAAEQIRRMDRDVVIIFITNTPHYAIKGYAVDALDYVLKPISYFAFTQRIERALARMKRREESFLTIPIKGGMQRVELGRIRYIELVDRTLLFHTTTGVISSYGALKNVEEKIESGFYRCNKCYLVNLDHVEKILADSAIVGGEEIQVSRAKRRGFLDALNNHINEVGK